MDEKKQNESVAQTEPESSADNDPGPAEKKIDENSELLENVSHESESKDSEMKAPPLDHDPNDDSIPNAAETDTAEKLVEIEPADEPPADGPKTPAQTEGEIETASVGAEEQTNDLAERETIETSARKISPLKVAVAAIVIVAAFCGFFIFDNKSKIKANSDASSKTSEKRELSPNRQKKNNIIKPLAPQISSIYNANIEEITSLRDTLLRKQEEVMRLKKNYQDGIEELEKEISDELQKGESSTFMQAMENNGIAFTLRTIQRRQAYIQQLERPLKWLFEACEELLYIKRRTVMDIQVAAIADGVDMKKHVRHINAAVRKYQPAADKLAPDMTAAQLEPLEIIWGRIQDKTRQYATVQAHSKNQIISEQICTGNFNRLTELSDISAETAICITEMQGSDLFLNGLAEISPGAARQLFQWKGSWICLNGVRALSPRVAHYLFQWDGNWISLNGLTEFPAEIGETLLQWGGHQLELMGLQYAEDFPTKIAVEYLARWERAGGKLFVPKKVRKKIDEMHREPQPNLKAQRN